MGIKTHSLNIPTIGENCTRPRSGAQFRGNPYASYLPVDQALFLVSARWRLLHISPMQKCAIADAHFTPTAWKFMRESYVWAGRP